MFLKFCCYSGKPFRHIARFASEAAGVEPQMILVSLLADQRPNQNQPAFATEFGSSKIASIRSILRETRFTESAFRNGCVNGVENPHSSSPGGTFRGREPFRLGTLSCFEQMTIHRR